MRWIGTRYVLLFSLAAEGVMAVGVILAPALVAQLLLGRDVSGAGDAFARLLGFALLALVIACRPDVAAPGGTRRAVRAMLVYNALAAAYLAYLGIAHRPVGLVLWPAVVAHTLVALLLAAGQESSRHSET